MNKGLRMVRALVTLLSPKHWGPFVEAAETSGFDHGFTISWSQGGEDLALLTFLKEIKNGSYVDVGAHHPDRFSVTRHLYQSGWSGVNIEANPVLLEAFEERRTRDVNLNFAVGLKDEYELAVFSEPAISTVNLEWRQKFQYEKQTITRILIVPGITLIEVLNRYFPTQQLDLLTIDAEGSDLEVLESLQLETLRLNRKPKWIMVETAKALKDVQNQDHVKLLLNNGYEIVSVLPMSTILQLSI
jgi:FkbM family methyltransferase